MYSHQCRPPATRVRKNALRSQTSAIQSGLSVAMVSIDGISQIQETKAIAMYRYPQGNSMSQTRYFKTARGLGGQS